MCSVTSKQAGRRDLHPAARFFCPPLFPCGDCTANFAAMSEKQPKSARRGRPSLERAIEIDQVVLECAYTRFLSEGFDGVAMEQVAADAAVSKGTLYARHPSKEALFTAVIEARTKAWSVEAAGEDHLLTDDIVQRLQHHADIIATWVCRPDVTGFTRTVLQAQQRFPELASKLFESGYMHIIGVIAQDIEEAAVRNGIPVRNAARVARTLVTGIGGFQSQEVMSGLLTEEQVHEQGRYLVSLLAASRPDW